MGIGATPPEPYSKIRRSGGPNWRMAPEWANLRTGKDLLDRTGARPRDKDRDGRIRSPAEKMIGETAYY
jgi:hypothetical protein